jgi:hypothetical protein
LDWQNYLVFSISLKKAEMQDCELFTQPVRDDREKNIWSDLPPTQCSENSSWTIDYLNIWMWAMYASHLRH